VWSIVSLVDLVSAGLASAHTKTTNSIGVWSSFGSTTSQRWRFINESPPCPQFDSKEMTMTPTEWLLYITTLVVVIALGVWFYRLTH
jgi:hypothetical protein